MSGVSGVRRSDHVILRRCENVMRTDIPTYDKILYKYFDLARKRSRSFEFQFEYAGIFFPGRLESRVHLGPRFLTRFCTSLFGTIQIPAV